MHRRGQVVSPSSVPGVILGSVAVVLGSVASSGVIPAPWDGFLALIGLVMAGLVGTTLPSFNFARGNAIVQGTLLTVLGSVFGIFEMLKPALLQMTPDSFDFIIGGVASLLLLLVGKSVPGLGAVELTKDDVVKELSK